MGVIKVFLMTILFMKEEAMRSKEATAGSEVIITELM